MYSGIGYINTGRYYGAFDADEEGGRGRIYDPQVMRLLPKYLRTVRSQMAWGIVGMVVRASASLVTPYLVAVAVDRYMATGDFMGVSMIAGVFLAVLLIGWAGQYVENLFLYYAGDGILLRLRTDMFNHLQRLSIGFLDRNSIGKIMSRVQNDVQQLQELVTSGVPTILISGLTLVGMGCVMMVMNARLALLTLAVVPALGAVLYVWQRYAHRSFMRVRRAIAVVNAQLQESLSGVRVIQSLGREVLNDSLFDEVNRAHRDANIRANRLTSTMMPVGEIAAAVATGLVIIFGGYQVLAGQMGIGVLLAFLLYVQRFFGPVQELIMEYAQLQRATVAGARIAQLLGVDPDIQDAPDAADLPSVAGEVGFHHVRFGYQPGTEVLHDVDLLVRPGETVAIVGHTGAGKSSLVNLLARFYDVGEGSVTIDGHDVRSVTQRSLRRQMGIVLQEPFLFSGSVEDNIRFARPEASHDEIVHAAAVVGAHEFISRLESGYDTRVGERGVNLSAGQRQLVCLARAIVADPPILVLDEATSSVDAATERIMQQSVGQVMQGRTCIIVAHRLSTVTDADRIVVLEQGRVVETGPHDELVAKRGPYYHLLRGQPSLRHEGGALSEAPY